MLFRKKLVYAHQESRVTNTETCMREMRHIASLFSKKNDFDEQWILFKAYLNTAHSLSDNDASARTDFYNNELMSFVLVLRNIVHHYPAKWHFGKHDVYPTGINITAKNGEGMRVTGSLSLVIQKDTLENSEMQKSLYKVQLKVLRNALRKNEGQLLVVSNIIQNVQVYVEQYCKQNNQYTEANDNESLGYNLIKNP